MPELTVSVLLSIVCTVFGAGVGWGVFKLTIGRTVEDLKRATSKLEGIGDRLILQEERTRAVAEVTKDHEERIRTLEIKTAGLAH